MTARPETPNWFSSWSPVIYMWYLKRLRRLSKRRSLIWIVGEQIIFQLILSRLVEWSALKADWWSDIWPESSREITPFLTLFFFFLIWEFRNWSIIIHTTEINCNFVVMMQGVINQLIILRTVSKDLGKARNIDLIIFPKSSLEWRQLMCDVLRSKSLSYTEH